MKKKVSAVLMCAPVLYVSLLCAVLTGCGDLSGTKPKPHVSTNSFIPEGISDSDFYKLPSERQTEIQNLYGCYWMTGLKDNCIKIGGGKLIIYSTAMSFSYQNIRWAELSPSTWVCCAYHADEENYSEDDRKVILKFTKEAGGVKVWQYIVPMELKSGPFTEVKEVEPIVEGTETFYVYDKNDPSCPKMRTPDPR